MQNDGLRRVERRLVDAALLPTAGPSAPRWRRVRRTWRVRSWCFSRTRASFNRRMPASKVNVWVHPAAALRATIRQSAKLAAPRSIGPDRARPRDCDRRRRRPWCRAARRARRPSSALSTPNVERRTHAVSARTISSRWMSTPFASASATSACASLDCSRVIARQKAHQHVGVDRDQGLRGVFLSIGRLALAQHPPVLGVEVLADPAGPCPRRTRACVRACAACRRASTPSAAAAPSRSRPPAR